MELFTAKTTESVELLNDINTLYLMYRHFLKSAKATLNENLKLPDGWRCCVHECFDETRFSIFKVNENWDGFESFQLTIRNGSLEVVGYENTSKVDWYLLKKQINIATQSLALNCFDAEFYIFKHFLFSVEELLNDLTKYLDEEWFVSLQKTEELVFSVLKVRKCGADDFVGFELTIKNGNLEVINYKNTSKVDWYLLKKQVDKLCPSLKTPTRLQAEEEIEELIEAGILMSRDELGLTA